jgi:cobalt-zinc-cadmium efflux system outer membrane protein
VLLASACASVDPRADVERVRALVTERSAGAPPFVDEGGQELVDARVRELLDGDLTPERAVAVAFLRNRSLQMLRARLGIARAEWAQAVRMPVPLLSAQLRLGVQESGTGADLGLAQALLRMLQLPVQRRIARAQLEESTLAIAQAVFELAIDVRRSLIEAQAAQQALELRDHIGEAVALAAELVRGQHAAGNVADLELAEQEALVQESQLQLADAQLDWLERCEALTALLGLRGDETRWTLASRLPPLPAEERAAEGLESLAVARRLDLAAARQRVLAAADGPALQGLLAALPGSAGLTAEREVESGDWSLGPSFEIALPVPGARGAERAIARERSRESEAELAALAVQIRSEVRRAWARMQAARARVLYFDHTVLPLRARILEQTQRRYNGMLAGAGQLLSARREQIRAGGDAVDALHAYWVARIELERALGTELAPDASASAHAHAAQDPDASHAFQDGRSTR